MPDSPAGIFSFYAGGLEAQTFVFILAELSANYVPYVDICVRAQKLTHLSCLTQI